MLKLGKFFTIASIFLSTALVSNHCLGNPKKGERMTNNCANVSKKSEFLKKFYGDALKEWGEPVSEEEFDLDKALVTEFRGGLLKFQSEWKNTKGISIRETTWAEGDCRLTLWFRKTENGYVAIDTLYWNKSMHF